MWHRHLGSNSLCPSCGRNNQPVTRYQTRNPYLHSAPYTAPSKHAAPKAFDQIFGIDPRLAFLAFIVDLMLFGTEIATLGIAFVLIPLAIGAGVVLAVLLTKYKLRGTGTTTIRP